MSIESLDITTTDYLLDVTNGTTQTLQITEGLTLELQLSEMGLQGPQGPAGSGDMDKSVYDTNDNGIVDAAESVPWSGVTDKPSTFTPSSHTQAISTITGLEDALAGKEPADATILKDADIGVTVQAYDADLTTWAGKTAPSGTVVGTSDMQTLTNKTIEGVVLDNGYTEEVYTVSGTTPALSPTNGSIQTWTLTGNSTPTSGTWNSGQGITLMVDDGSAYAVNWTSLAVTWKTNAGAAPTLNTSGYTVIALWKVSSTIYGARVGDA